MEKVRRRHVPAFAEWNYYSSSFPDEPELPRCGGGAVVDWWYVPEPDACSDVWFKYSLAPKKVRRSEAGGRKTAGATPVRASDRGAAAKGGGTRRMVRPVDEDLYQVLPPEFTTR